MTNLYKVVLLEDSFRYLNNLTTNSVSMSSKNLLSGSNEATASKTNVLTTDTDIETGARTNEAGERPEKNFCPIKMQDWMFLEIDHLIKHVKKEEGEKPAIKVYTEKAIAVYNRLAKKAREIGICIADFKKYSTVPEKFQIFYEQLKEMKLTA